MDKCPITGMTASAAANANIQGCPVIHAVNDDEIESDNNLTKVEEEKSEETNEEEEEQESGDAKSIIDPFDFEEEFKNDIPSVREYKKLKRITGMITGFYKNGTKTKGEQYEAVKKDLERIDVDIQMAKEQLESLDDMMKYKGHLKLREYIEDLSAEIERLENQRKQIEETANHFKGLHEWSKEIVKICEWLEMNLDSYCNDHLKLPKSVLKNLKPVPELTDEERKYYEKGLDEITHNLNESRDFFEASVDGRLQKYQEIQKVLIDTQLEVLKKYSEDNPRRQLYEDQLNDELKGVSYQIENAKLDSTKHRRVKMLDLHKDFLKVLKFFTDRIGLLKTDGKGEHDPRYTNTFTL